MLQRRQMLPPDDPLDHLPLETLVALLAWPDTDRPLRASASPPRPASRQRQRHPAVCSSPSPSCAKPTPATRTPSRTSLHRAHARHRALRPNAVPAGCLRAALPDFRPALPHSAQAGSQAYSSMRAQWAARPSIGLPPALAPPPAVGAWKGDTEPDRSGAGLDGEVPAVLGAPRPAQRERTVFSRSPGRPASDQSAYALSTAPLRLLEAALKRGMGVHPIASHMRDPHPELPRPFIAQLNRQRPKAAGWSSAGTVVTAGTSVGRRKSAGRDGRECWRGRAF
jgi:hypothetical protein